MVSSTRGPTAPFLVFYGDEDFFLDRALEAAKRWPDRSVTYLNANEKLNDITLLQELESQTVDDVPRTIIIEDAQKLKETKQKPLREYLEVFTKSTTVLVALVRTDKLPELWRKVGEKGKVLEHKKFKPWADRLGKTEYHKWADTEAKRVGLVLEEGVAEFIVQMTGDDLYRIVNEIRKLHLLVGGGKVTKQHVASIIAITPTSEPREVVEAAFAKNIKGAMNALSLVYKNMGDEASVPIVYGLMRETQKTLTARAMLDSGLAEDDIAAALSMNPWRCKTFFLPTVRKHSQGSLIKHMQQLCRLDQDVKSSSRSKRTLVELTVLSILG